MTPSQSTQRAASTIARATAPTADARSTVTVRATSDPLRRAGSTRATSLPPASTGIAK